MSIFKYRNVEVQLLRQHWMHFVRDHSTCWVLHDDIKVVHVDETIFHHNRKTAIITLYKPS